MIDQEREIELGFKVERSLSEVTTAAEGYAPVIGAYAMFSGGNDSLTSTSVTAQHPLFKGVIHINTGIGIEETREFVRSTCKREGWPLIEVHPPGRTYENLVMEYGFPGPSGHGVMFRYLKERAVRKVVRDIKAAHPEIKNGKVILTTGARISESQRRMINIKKMVEQIGSQVWVSLIHNWNGLDTGRYIEMKGYPRNRVSDVLHMSGECLCGAFATADEYAELKVWFPEDAARIEALEVKVAACGIDHGVKCAWGWGQGFKETPDQDVGPLCSSCELRGTMAHHHEHEEHHGDED